MIPVGVKELHHAHPALHEPTREQAVVGKEAFPGCAPYISSVAADSFEMSISSGTLACIRYAISYWLMRVAISGSPTMPRFCSFSDFTASST